MNDLIRFDFQGVAVRTVLVDGEPWWVAKDVCDVLGLVESHRSIAGLDEDEKGRHTMTTPGGEQSLVIISEPGLYSLILRSRKEEVKAFKRWITHEVIPQIRRTGVYYAAVPKTLPEALRLCATEIEKREEAERQLQIAAPKVAFYDQVAGSRDAIDMRRVAAVLNVPGWGRNKLFAFLREHKILDERNTPYREYQDRGYFRVVEQTYTDSAGETHISLKTLVYQKGVSWIRRMLEKECAA